VSLVRWLLGTDVAFVHQFHAPPWGGGNQFLLALKAELERRGLAVSANGLGPRTRACLFNSFNFRPRQLRPLLGTRARMVHRVDGPVGTYRGTDAALDRRIWRLNGEFAAATVFQSRYSLESHAALGLEFRSPLVIPNAVDPAIFHRGGEVGLFRATGRKIRLISTSWSDNPNKGAATYRWIEEHLDWNRYEYTFVGRSAVAFERIRVLPPVASPPLAALLREHDIYVTASLHESCSNGLLEALACGLPALYVRSGSNGELVGSAGLGFGPNDEILPALERLVVEYEARRDAISLLGLSEVGDRYLGVLGIPARVPSAPDGGSAQAGVGRA